MPMYIDSAAAQFENVNALRQYPFADDASLVDSLGRTLPQDVITDVHLFVPADIEGDSSGVLVEGGPVVKMTSLHMSQSMVSVCFSTTYGGSVYALSVTVAKENLRPYTPYRLEKLYGSYDIGGVVTFGDFDLPGFPETYRFSDAIVHESCVAMTKPAQLRSIVDRRSGERLAGDVRIRFSSYVESERNGKKFTLSLEEGAAEELMSECDELKQGDNVCGATPIVSINGVRPDANGNIVLWFH